MKGFQPGYEENKKGECQHQTFLKEKGSQSEHEEKKNGDRMATSNCCNKRRLLMINMMTPGQLVKQPFSRDSPWQPLFRSSLK